MEERDAERLVRSPAESLSLELKTWLNLDQPDHKAKLVRALLAMRNYNGGYILIGFDDKNGQPAECSTLDPRIAYHVDVLQGLVSTYASQPFGIQVAYPERNGMVRPIIEVPAGVQVPVAVQKGLFRDGNKMLLRKGDVMFRTLAANNIVSSAAAEPDDWPSIMNICFNNREADLAGFVRRHLLSSELPDVLAELGASISRANRPSLEESCRAFAEECASRALEREQTRGLPDLPDAFGTVEIVAVLDPPTTGYIADEFFVNRLMLAHPRYSFELWQNNRGFSNPEDRPIAYLGGWETLADHTGFWVMREFARIEPTGRFYLRRPLPEDSSAGARDAQPGKIVDIGMTIATVVEAMATVIAFANALRVGSDAGKAGLLFSYGGLRGRRLVSLNGAVDLIAFERRSETDGYSKFIEIPTDTSPMNLGPFVLQVVRELFALFNGYTINPNNVEQRTRAFVERRQIG